MTNTIKHYNDNAKHYFSLYNSLESESVHLDWKKHLKDTDPRTALDIGAGSGRDARWLSSKGWKVIAVEPATNLNSLASEVSSEDIHWCSSTLPLLADLPNEIPSYDLILLSAVWMHIALIDQLPAMERLAELLAPKGKIFISLRYGPNDLNRPMNVVNVEELGSLASKVNLLTRDLSPSLVDDKLNRHNVKWKTVELIHDS